MHRIIIVAKENEGDVIKLALELGRRGFACSIASGVEGLVEQSDEQAPDLVLVDMSVNSTDTKIGELCQRMRMKRHLPVIALTNGENLDGLYTDLNLDDFIVKPYDPSELSVRIKRALSQVNNGQNKEVIRCNELLIDLAKYEVSINGIVLELTFREYELLKFLASNRGRVFSRETLLNRVWGYDYYGGDRTVDVHIRRLRSKIEISGHAFIETVRNIGYRFKGQA